jgi:protein TonB
MAMHSLTDHWFEPAPFDWRGWVLPAFLAFGMHVFLLWLVSVQSEGPAFPMAQTIRVNLLQLASPSKHKPEQPKFEEVVKPIKEPVRRAVAPSPEPLHQANSSEPVEAAKPLEVSDSVTQPAIPDSSPDYRAANLHNPPPLYPHAARRRGLQGRVLLHVEVMAAGHCGRIEVQQSSGHDILDTAAITAVKDWNFIPATHLGFAVTSWLHIPIRFELTARQ